MTLQRTRPISLVMAIVLAGCSVLEARTPDIGDGGFLSGLPCPAPCFYGVTPGSTQLHQAMEILRAADLCPNPAQFDSRPEGGTLGFNCGSRITVSSRDSDLPVDTVGFSPSELLTVGMVVEVRGSPDAVVVAPASIPESRRVAMFLLYDDVLAMLLLPEQQGSVFRLPPSTSVERVGYLDEDAYKSVGLGSVPWAGFTSYSSDQ